MALSRRWVDAIPEAPLGTNPPAVELRTWVELRFSADGSKGVAQGLVNLLDDLMDDELRALLAKGWVKEIRYLAALLGQMDLPRDGDAHRCASLLFDALNGAMLRRATEPTAPGPEQVLDDLLEVWT